MSVGARGQLEVGERAPDFVSRGPSGQAARFYAHAGGRPTAVIFTPAAPHPVADRQLAQLASRLAGRDDVALCRVATGPAAARTEHGADDPAADPPAACRAADDLAEHSPAGRRAAESRAAEGRAAGPPAAVTAWADPEGRVAAAYGVTLHGATAVVLDRNLRVVGVLTGDQLVDRAVELLGAAAPHASDTQVTEATAHAPVLMIPDALPGVWCERLVGLWHSEGGVDTGVARGATEVLDDHYKRRRDHTVRDPELTRDLSSVVGRRVMPELRKAFAYRATRFEGFKIACYDASAGGFFRPHRDNLTPATAHRAFALTLNLNEEYQGGQLRFPEYGNQLYRPGAGVALVFSCAHLHEVQEVTVGRRFVLLSFLYGEPPPERRRSQAAP